MYKVYRVNVGDVFYIGCTSNYAQRSVVHRSQLKTNSHFNSKLQSTYNSLVTKKCSIEVLHTFDNIVEALNKEQELIELNKDNVTCKNMNLGNNTWISCENSKLRKENMSKGMQIYYESLTEEERTAKYGRCGKLNGMYSKTQSEETKAKCRSNIKKAQEANIGRVFSEEHKAKIRESAVKRVGEANPFFGKQHSAEAKAKLSAANKGRLPINARKVIAEGKEFLSVTDCARYYGITYNAVAFRIKSNSFDFHYINA
jgi:predicted GIY-YIG superfamily endonuclease